MTNKDKIQAGTVVPDTLHIGGPIFGVEPRALDTRLCKDMLAVGTARRDVRDAVKSLIAEYGITGDAEYMRAVLYEYGAWTDEELHDDAENLRRAVWIICSDLAECGESYFSVH